MMTMRYPRGDERGQTFPMWTFAVFTALTLMFFSFNYANTLRWQVRAQNAADAAATAALSVQATQWNKMTSLLYAADVEEWRIRHILDGMLAAGKGDGGCSPAPGNPVPGNCTAVYGALRTQYYKAVNRYTHEIQLLQALAPVTTAQQSADASAIVAHLAANGGKTFGGDSAFTYKVIDYRARTANLLQVSSDAFFVDVGFPSTSDPTDSTTPILAFSPAQIEIATCATVPPLINFSFPGLPPPPSFTVIGRAAATTVMVTQEWFEPGTFLNPHNGNAVFQAAESYIADGVSNPSPRDWYQTNFPTQTYQVNGTQTGYQANTVAEDFSVRAAWWATIPFAPYTGVQTKAALGCP
jgi:hypothetical protein